MSSTRYSADPADFAPERGLSSPRLRGINIGLNVVTRVARAHPDPMRRAMIWLTNYALVQGLTADALSDQLGLSKADVRAALTDPDYEDASRFAGAVEAMRSAHDSAIHTLVDTRVNRDVSAAMQFALAAGERSLNEIVGKTRMGKSDCARPHWLRNLDRCLWVECPSDDSDRSFLFEIARQLGIGTSGGKKAGQIRAQIKPCFGPQAIECLVVDEGHRLWPSDPKAKPKRIEYLRELYADGRGCSVVIIATPQHTESLHQSLAQSARWSPGQYDGRVVRWHLRDTMSERDLAAVARHYAPDLSQDLIDTLVLQAQATEGYCGLMVNTIRLARFRAGAGDITRDLLLSCISQMMSGTRIAVLAASAPPAKGGARK